MRTNTRLTLFSLTFIALLTTTLSVAQPPAMDDSRNGTIPVEVLEFPHLKDLHRESVSTPQRRRLFRRNAPPSKTEPGRRVPIKLHLPTGVGPYPVVIISHGAGGNWDTHYAQAHHLASHGFAVLCLEHVGSNSERMKTSPRLMRNLKEMIYDSTEVLGRPADIRFAVDQIAEWNVSDPKLRGRLDLNKIGVMGHSFGAFTVMVVGGMRPALNWIRPQVGTGSGLGPSLLDGRIKCGVALSPQAPGEPFFLEESYRSLSIPLLGISGTKDKQQSGEAPIARYHAFELWPKMNGQNFFIWLTNAGHLDFSDSTGGDQQGLRSSTRADVQTVVRAATLRFFNSCLKSKGEKDGGLSAESLRPYLKGAISDLEVRRK